jgi:transposase
MNRLKMDIQHAISSLSRNGWSQRRIARELGIDRETVARYRKLARQAEQPKPAISPAGSKPGRISHCEPFTAAIQVGLDRGLSAQRIYQDLVAEQQFGGSYDSVKRFVRQLEQARPLPFRRIETAPGQEAQVDFGQGAWVVENGKRRRRHVLRVVLSHSRKGYTEAFWRQTTENFIRGLENALRPFGGVVSTLVIDNLRAAVQKVDWFEPELNPKVVSFCEHYGTVILPTKPAMPRHKGKVEAGVDYVQENALAGKQFESLAAQNLHLAHWESTVADTRIHGTTRQQVGRHFLEVEKPALQPLPASLFPCFSEAPRKVHRDGYVEVDKAYYSAPPEYVRRSVWARWDAKMVRRFNERMEPIAVHVQGVASASMRGGKNCRASPRRGIWVPVGAIAISGRLPQPVSRGDSACW